MSVITYDDATVGYDDPFVTYDGDDLRGRGGGGNAPARSGGGTEWKDVLQPWAPPAPPKPVRGRAILTPLASFEVRAVGHIRLAPPRNEDGDALSAATRWSEVQDRMMRQDEIDLLNQLRKMGFEIVE